MFKIVALVLALAALAQANDEVWSAADEMIELFSDRIDNLESCIGKDAPEAQNELTALLETCAAENNNDVAIRLCLIKATLRTDLKDIGKLAWCLFES